MDEVVARTEASLYDRDFHAWTRQQAALLKHGRLEELDLVNVLEEIESLGRKEVSELRSRFAVLALHLIKMIYQPKRSTRSWRSTIIDQRWEIAQLIADNPSLKPHLKDTFETAYAKARRLAVNETMLPEQTFPTVPPFTVDQALSEGWYPGQGGGANEA